MAKPRWTPEAAGALMWIVFFLLLVPAGYAGWVIGHSSRSETTSTTTTPAGHSGGANLAVADIGDAALGRALFVSKGCSDCHSYLGKGGSDAPALDFMRGHLSANEIANMSGRIWDHLPQMLPHFKEEGIPVPTFGGDQMANLIAYLHSGQGGAPAVKAGMNMSEGG
jgi:hypothetical protein